MHPQKQRQINFREFLFAALAADAAPGTDLDFLRRQFGQVRSVEEKALKLAGAVKLKAIPVGGTFIYGGNLCRKTGRDKAAAVYGSGNQRPLRLHPEGDVFPASEERAAEILGYKLEEMG